MPLRDKLRADHDIDTAFLDVAEFLPHALDRGDELARGDENALAGKQRVRLSLQPPPRRLMVLHLTTNWPGWDSWQGLFNAVCGPPVPATT